MIELNRIALPITELESANSALRVKNTNLQNLLIIGVVIIAIILAENVMKNNEEQDERKIKSGFPKINGNHSV